MFGRPYTLFMVLVLVGGTLAGQDKKPDAKGAVKPFEGTVAGRKVTLAIPEGWTELKPAATPDLPPTAAPWKLVGAWKSGKYEELSLRLFGVEKAGATATSVRDAWFDRAKADATTGFLVKADVANAKDKAMTGHDLEVDLKKGDEKVYAWIRVLSLGKDKVAVLLFEARPLKPPEVKLLNQETFVREPHVQEIQPILASFMKPAGKPDDIWTRGPTFDISRGPASLKVEAPKGWEYTRLGPEGSVIWMAPGDSQREFIVGFMACDGEAKLQAETMLIEATGGKIYENHPLPSGGHEIISALTMGDRTLWNWRRMYQRGEISISVLAKVPIKDVATPPAADIQKESKTFQDSVRVAK